MNGLNRQKKTFKNKTILVMIIYIIASISVIIIVNNLPEINDIFKEREVKKLKGEINEILNSSAQKRDLLANLEKEYPIELVVLNNDNVEYSKTPITDLDILNVSVNENVIYLNSQYKVQNDNNQEFEVWLLVYDNIAFQLFDIITIVFVSSFLIVSVILTYMVYTSSRLLIKPLDFLNANLKKLKEYKFDGVMTTDEKVELFSEELREFAQDIKTKSEEFGVAYTSLEKELLMKEEESSYKKQIVSSLVHDLKTPLSIIKLHANELEQETAKEETLREQNLTLKDINSNADAVLSDVKEILNVVNLKKVESAVESFDLVAQVKQSTKLFAKLFRDKGLIVNLEMVPNAIVIVNKVEMQSIINNAMANIYKYATTNSEVDINIVDNKDQYIVTFENETENIEKIDFENAFSLFQVNDKSKDGTGVGLFVVNKFVIKNSGNCSFCRKDKKVVLSIVLPKNEGERYE